MAGSTASTVVTLIIKVLGFVSLVILWWRGNRYRRVLRHRMERKVRLVNPDARFALDPKTATVVHETTTPSGTGKHSYDIHHRLLRNPHGQYFLHIYSPAEGSSHVQYLPRDRAMNALRSDPEAYRREFGELPAPPAGTAWPF